MVLLLLAGAVGAQERLVTLRASTSVAWDDNVFRLPDSAPDPHLARGIEGKADRLTTTAAGVALAKSYAQQRFLLDVGASATRFDKFSFLDREAATYRGEWQWHATPHLRGSLSADRSETPIPFDETRDLERNEVTVKNRAFTVVASPLGRWQLLGGLREAERRYLRPSPSEVDTRHDAAEAGVRYSARSGNMLSLQRRVQRGVGTGQLAAATVAAPTGGFVVEENEAQAAWLVTGRSTLNGRITAMRRRHQDAPERNFSGVGRELGHVWLATGRLTVTSSASRALSPHVVGVSASYRVDDTLAVSPSWQLTEKWRLGMRLARQSTDYLGPVAASALPARHDDLRSVAFSADWSPWRALRLQASLRLEDRSSNDPQFSFQGRVVGLTAAVEL